MQIAAEGISSSRQFPLSRQTLVGPFLHGMGLFCGQKLPPGTRKVAPGTLLPRWAPYAWTGGNIFPPRPQKIPLLWTKVTFWHQTSTKSTSCVDRRQHFSSASTKDTFFVDKSYLLVPGRLLPAPCFHAGHPQRGQAATFSLRVHKRYHFCGQKPPTGAQKFAPGTELPRWAPSAWTGGNIFPPRPQKIPFLWTKVTFWHQTSTKSTSYVDKSRLRAPKRLLRVLNFHAGHPQRGQAAAILFLLFFYYICFKYEYMCYE